LHEKNNQKREIGTYYSENLKDSVGLDFPEAPSMKILAQHVQSSTFSRIFDTTTYFGDFFSFLTSTIYMRGHGADSQST